MTENYEKLFFLATAKEGDVWHEITNYTIVKDGRVITYATCSCGKNFLFDSTLDEHIKNSNPTYDNPRDILKRMREYCGEERFDLFMAQLEYGNNTNVEGIDWSGNIDIDYILNPPALLKKAVEFLKGEGR